MDQPCDASWIDSPDIAEDRSDLVGFDQPASDLLVGWDRWAKFLDSVRERVMTDVVKQRGGDGSSCRLVGDRRPFRNQALEGHPHQVHDAE